MNLLYRLEYLVYKTKHKSLSQLFYYIFVEYMICNILRDIHFRILRRGKKFAIVNVQGSLMLLDLIEPGINRDLYQFRIREKTATKVYQDIIKKDMKILDIGANIGYYALMAGKVGADVTAFEPVDANFEQLQYNIDLNNYHNIKAWQCAVGLMNKQDTIYVTEKCNGSTLRHKIGKPQKVRVINLDEWYFGQKKPDVIRMDVEGYEWEILKGSPETLADMEIGSWIFVEIHEIGSQRAVEVENMLYRAGFDLIHELPIEGKEGEKFNYMHYRNKFNLKYDKKGCKECFFQKVHTYDSDTLRIT